MLPRDLPINCKPILRDQLIIVKSYIAQPIHCNVETKAILNGINLTGRQVVGASLFSATYIYWPNLDNVLHGKAFCKREEAMSLRLSL